MTKDEAIAKLKKPHLYGSKGRASQIDVEVTHSEADVVLLEFLRTNGFPDVADAWDKLNAASGGFWYS